MEVAAIALLLANLGVLGIFTGFLIWGAVSGQFHNVEEPKYRMLSPEYRGDGNKGEDINA
jgi:nitrogen fixation-related uncharacterized protein